MHGRFGWCMRLVRRDKMFSLQLYFMPMRLHGAFRRTGERDCLANQVSKPTTHVLSVSLKLHSSFAHESNNISIQKSHMEMSLMHQTLHNVMPDRHLAAPGALAFPGSPRPSSISQTQACTPKPSSSATCTKRWRSLTRRKPKACAIPIAICAREDHNLCAGHRVGCDIRFHKWTASQGRIDFHDRHQLTRFPRVGETETALETKES